MKEAFHERLARLRKSQNLTAKEVADYIEVPASTYRDWENGKGLRVPPYQKISHVLNVSLAELITGKRPELGDAIELLEDLEKKVREIKAKVGTFI
jgi:transcriptional regulator with XRE-family HTH domain